MKSLIAIGVIALLPFLAIFTLLYFGMHAFKGFSTEKKTLLNRAFPTNLNRKTVSVQ